MSAPTIPDAILNLLTQIHNDVRSLDKRLLDHIEEEENMIRTHDEKIETMEREVIALHAAFPNADMAGHQLYHASVIKRNEFLAEVLKETAKHIAKYGLIGFVIWIAGHAISDLAHKLIESIGK